MAERRMFAKSIVTSDAFLDMPATARCLYFTLAMFADDDGFVNSPKSIMRQVGSTTDDMNILVSKKFVIAFDSGVIVIKHWRIHNYIRGDRKHETKYLDELSTLDLEENGAYTQKSEPMELLEQDDAKTMRQKAYAESELPYSFDYKIRQAFWNKKCPVCGVTMNSGYLCKPTIQHNIPISKGGKHELGNISVICQKCNASIRNNETDKLNAEEVIEVWEDICQASDNQTTVNGIPRLGKVRLGKSKDRLVEDSQVEVNLSPSQVRGEFEELWKLYPKKRGKKRACSCYESTRIKHGIAFETIKDGMESYIRWFNLQNKDIQYMKDGDTFFSQWSWQDDWSVSGRVDSTFAREADDILDGIL